VGIDAKPRRDTKVDRGAPSIAKFGLVGATKAMWN